MLRVASVLARLLAIAAAAGAAAWLTLSTPPSAGGKAGLFLIFLISFAVIAHWICEVHVLAPTRAKQLVSALAASAIATGLLAAVLAIPNEDVRERTEPAAPTSTDPAKAPLTPTAAPSVDVPLPSASSVDQSPAPPKPKAISTDTAFDFFTKTYFPTALDDPIRALQQYGTANFQKQKERTGVASYVSFYEDTLSIPVDQVRVARDGNSPDTFDVRFLRGLKSGSTTAVATKYGVRCSDVSLENPYACPSGDIRVDSSATIR